MDKENFTCPYNRILLGHKKEWGIYICYNLEPRKHYAKGKKPVTKDHK